MATITKKGPKIRSTEKSEEFKLQYKLIQIRKYLCVLCKINYSICIIYIKSRMHAYVQ